ncbi:MAG: nucleoside triphosphate pyrophosphohydrolase family protein [Erysipelotrichaceae bacterium]|nr:nucleoside triphosphate pyrophosphohydrolase family protein [Erysipelotrichaceae bacterium]
MDANAYQKKAMAFLNPQIEEKDVLLNALMGLCAESGEACDLLKKHLFQGHSLNRDDLIKELGDVAWYLAEAAYALDVDLSDVLDKNIGKLTERFPDGFDPQRSMARKDQAEYRFYGACKGIRFLIRDHEELSSPEDLYDLFSSLWSKQTCAPRMADEWTEENKTLGQCSITSFLVQDLIGGEVFGIRLDDGNFHCFNRIGGEDFDLTSEQFTKALDYSDAIRQDRQVHFAKEEKYQRYLLLKRRLEEKLTK